MSDKSGDTASTKSGGITRANRNGAERRVRMETIISSGVDLAVLTEPKKREGVILENTVSPSGLRWLHVMRSSAPVDRDAWINFLPPHALETLQVYSFEERDLRMHHLEMWWWVREPCYHNTVGKRVDGLLWWYKGQRLSAVLEYLLGWYVVYFGTWPNRAAVKQLPPGAPAVAKVTGDVRQPVVEIALEEAAWVPQHCVWLWRSA